MSVKIEMFMIVGRKYLDEYYSSSFKQFENCCGVCWCCFKKKSILDEFEKKGFNSFNSNVKGWKLMVNLNKFEIFPLDLLETVVSQESTVSTCFYFSKEKMAKVLSKEDNLKFTKESFRELDVPDLFINLWTYNYFEKHKPCIACDTYSRYCEEILKEIWCSDWGNFDLVVERLKKCNQAFININNYSSSTKWSILDELFF